MSTALSLFAIIFSVEKVAEICSFYQFITHASHFLLTHHKLASPVHVINDIQLGPKLFIPPEKRGLFPIFFLVPKITEFGVHR